MEKAWENYEDVAAYLLNKCAMDFGVDFFEGKQEVPGDTGTKWEIDAKGVKADDGGFMIVECKRWTTRAIPQETVGGLAFRIIDTGAKGAILVSPMGLQDGAKIVANATKIFEVKLDPTSTPHQFALQFLDKFAVGVATTMFISGSASCEVERALAKPREAEIEPN